MLLDFVFVLVPVYDSRLHIQIVLNLQNHTPRQSRILCPAHSGYRDHGIDHIGPQKTCYRDRQYKSRKEIIISASRMMTSIDRTAKVTDDHTESRTDDQDHRHQDQASSSGDDLVP